MTVKGYALATFFNSCDLYPTFRDYIIKTAQHLYIKDVLENFKSNLRGRQIEDVKTNEFENWVENWDSILRDKSKTCELISFGEKTTNIDNIEGIIELICLLTKTRGRMIISLLKKKSLVVSLFLLQLFLLLTGSHNLLKYAMICLSDI